MTQLPKLKLTYFDFDGGRGEAIRLALTLAQVPFEDDRLGREGFAAVREQLPYGALPVLYVDGKPLAQSNAIARYVGKLTDLYPADPWDAALCDEVLDTVEEVTTLIGVTMPLAEDLKKERRQYLVSNVLPSLLKGLQARLTQSDGEYFSGGRMSVADLKVSDLVGWLCSGHLDHIPTDFVHTTSPALVRHHEGVKNHRAITSYYASRKKS